MARPGRSCAVVRTKEQKQSVADFDVGSDSAGAVQADETPTDGMRGLSEADGMARHDANSGFGG